MEILTTITVTVAVGELTFGDDEMSQALNLDESTTVDPGDLPGTVYRS